LAFAIRFLLLTFPPVRVPFLSFALQGFDSRCLLLPFVSVRSSPFPLDCICADFLFSPVHFFPPPLCGPGLLFWSARKGSIVSVLLPLLSVLAILESVLIAWAWVWALWIVFRARTAFIHFAPFLFLSLASFFSPDRAFSVRTRLQNFVLRVLPSSSPPISFFLLILVVDLLPFPRRLSSFFLSPSPAPFGLLIHFFPRPLECFPAVLFRKLKSCLCLKSPSGDRSRSFSRRAFFFGSVFPTEAGLCTRSPFMPSSELPYPRRIIFCMP